MMVHNINCGNINYTFFFTISSLIITHATTSVALQKVIADTIMQTWNIPLVINSAFIVDCNKSNNNDVIISLSNLFFTPSHKFPDK